MALTLFEDTFVLVSRADELLENRSSLWSGSTTTEKEIALAQATQLLNDQHWIGRAVTANQLLAWPRTYADFYDEVLNQTVVVGPSTIPLRLERATANLALHLLTYPELLQGLAAESFGSISLGPLSVSESSEQGKSRVAVVPYASVRKLLKPLVVTGGDWTWWRAN